MTFEALVNLQRIGMLDLDVDASTVRVLDGLRKQRNLADYEGDFVTESLLQECIEQAIKLLDTAKQKFK